MKQAAQSQPNTNTKEKIIATAETLFSKYSYGAVSMNDIANVVKATKAALYYHFKSKEELFIEMAKEVFKDFSNIIDEVLSKDIPLEKKFKEFLATYINFSVEKRDLTRLMMQKFSKNDEKIIKLLHEFKQKIINQIEPLVNEILMLKGLTKKADSRLLTLLLIGSLNALITSEMIKSPNNLPAIEVADQVASLIFTNK